MESDEPLYCLVFCLALQEREKGPGLLTTLAATAVRRLLVAAAAAAACGTAVVGCSSWFARCKGSKL